MVIDNNGRTDCIVWGDIMTQYAGARSIGIADANGVLVVARDKAREVAECAHNIEKVEADIRP